MFRSKPSKLWISASVLLFYANFDQINANDDRINANDDRIYGQKSSEKDRKAVFAFNSKRFMNNNYGWLAFNDSKSSKTSASNSRLNNQNNHNNINSNSGYVDQYSIELDNAAMLLAKRLKSGLNPNHISFLKETSDGIKIYYPTESGTGTFGNNYGNSNNGLPIARIAEVEINANVDKISEKWLDQTNRKEWDKTISESQTHAIPGTAHKFHYIVRKPVSYWSYLAPGRNFVYRIVKKPGAALGVTDFNVVAFISLDASSLLPSSWSTIRGHANAILVLQPIGLNRTRVTYLLELAPGGWFWIPSIASLLAGDNLVGTLSSLKAALEYDEMAEYEGLSVDEAARRQFAKERARAANREAGGDKTSLIEDVAAQREDLVATLALLEKKLADVKRMESQDQLDLSELKARITADIAKTKKRLQSM